MLLLWILVLVLGIAYLAHRRTAPLPALGVVAVYLLAMGAFSHAPGWLLHREAGGYAARVDGSPYKPTHRTGGLLYAPDAGSWHAARKALLGEAVEMADAGNP